MKQILLNGGLGFIGFHTAKELEKNPDFNTIIFDASRKYIQYGVNFDPYIRRKKLLNNSTIIDGDCNDIDLYTKTWIAHKPDILIHFASLPIVWKAEADPDLAQKDIEKSIESVLIAIEKSGHFPQKIIYISSSMVYGNFQRDGNNSIIPAVESQKTEPIDIYGQCKLAGEKMVEKFCNKRQLDYTIIRPSAVYGPEDYNKRVVELFVMNALKGKEIIVSGNGELSLDFTYVEDLANGIIACLTKKTQHKIFNLTYGKGYTINHLAEVLKIHFPNLEIKNGLIHPNRPNRSYLDISMAKSELDFFPNNSLEEGIKKYINYLKEHKIYD